MKLANVSVNRLMEVRYGYLAQNTNVSDAEWAGQAPRLLANRVREHPQLPAAGVLKRRPTRLDPICRFRVILPAGFRLLTARGTCRTPGADLFKTHG